MKTVDSDNNNNLLEVKELSTHFFTERGVIPSVDKISFSMNKGETLAIVGESGCGKSVTSFSLMRLVSPPGKIVSGEVIFEGQDLLQCSEKEMRNIRGGQISMIFQEPLTSLNPIFTVGDQIAEAIMLHDKVNKAEAKAKSVSMLTKVGIARAEKIYDMFPHSLSGGMRQRVMIAMALSCNPKLLIADEPTTALDVTIQAQILDLLKQLQQELHTSIILITHDLGVVAELVDRVIVMYAGQIVEDSDVYTLFREPKHPYTQGLLNSTPKIHMTESDLQSIEGVVPSPSEMPSGCRFHPRCKYAMDQCVSKLPELKGQEDGNKVRCFLYGEGGETMWNSK